MGKQNVAETVHLVAAPERDLGPDRGMGRYVLVVDDEPDAQEILTDIVGALGFETQTASDGHEAVEWIRTEIPDLVLLDLMMPRMDGFGVLSRLQSNPSTRQVPVIVITAVEPGQLSMMQLPGVAHVVQKGTFTIESLTELIIGCLGEPTE